jgi:hypothetical protein
MGLNRLMRLLVFWGLFCFPLNIYAFKLHFLDAFSGASLSNTKIILVRENTIRCIDDPCPSNEKEYFIVTDENGAGDLSSFLHPSKGLVRVNISGYHSVHIGENLRPSEVNTIQMSPVKIDGSYRKLTIYSRTSNEPISGLEVVFSRSKKDCYKAPCENTVFRKRTNKLGHIFYKFLEAFPKGLSEESPIWLHTENFLPHARHHHHKGVVKLIPRKRN